jgi:phosphatidylethanolamine-binding protein
MLVSIVSTLTFALLSHAQTTTNNTQLGVEAIEAHFSNAGIVPSLLKQFTPSGLLTVNFNGVGPVQPGQNLTVDR